MDEKTATEKQLSNRYNKPRGSWAHIFKNFQFSQNFYAYFRINVSAKSVKIIQKNGRFFISEILIKKSKSLTVNSFR